VGEAEGLGVCGFSVDAEEDEGEGQGEEEKKGILPLLAWGESRLQEVEAVARGEGHLLTRQPDEVDEEAKGGEEEGKACRGEPFNAGGRGVKEAEDGDCSGESAGGEEGEGVPLLHGAR